jgi:hypothetical protein
MVVCGMCCGALIPVKLFMFNGILPLICLLKSVTIQDDKGI